MRSLRGVGDIDIALGVHRHAQGLAGLAGIRALGAPRGEGFAARRELLDAVVAAIGDIDVTLGIHSHAPRRSELARSALRPAKICHSREGGCAAMGVAGNVNRIARACVATQRPPAKGQPRRARGTTAKSERRKNPLPYNAHCRACGSIPQ